MNPIGKGKVPYKNNKPPETKIQPKKGEEGHVKKVAGLGRRIKDDYIEKNTQPVDFHPSGMQSPNFGQKNKLGSVDETMDPPEDLPPALDIQNENPLIIQGQSKASIANDKAPVIARDVFGTGNISKKEPITNKSITNRPMKTHEENELKNNPLMQKFRKKAEYEGEIKQSSDDVNLEKDFAEKAREMGYRFDTDFEMYLPIKEGEKEALTKEEMIGLLKGKQPAQASFKPREMKFEGRTAEMDAFAADSFLKFNEDAGMYVSDNPFATIKDATIDELKEMMASTSDKEKIDAAAKDQGYSPIPGMDGVYQNVANDIKVADDFR